MNILVTGGAGYIGSHTVVELMNAGHHPIIADNLSHARRDVCSRIGEICGKVPPFYEINCTNWEELQQIFRDYQIDAVIHFADFKDADESIREPLKYYWNNLNCTLSLLKIMKQAGCNKLVFSSSATIYSPDLRQPYKEGDSALYGASPYGWTKVMNERILIDYCRAHPDFCTVLLRYFHAVGAHESGLLGDNPNSISNNMMYDVNRVAAGRLDKLTVFGADYDTLDGTCQRDYIHVVDLAIGHMKALEYAADHKGFEIMNLGSGKGTSVMELVDAFEKVNGIRIPCELTHPRDGDLPACWVDTAKAKELLGWEAARTLEDMCRSSWNYAKQAIR